MTVSEEDLVVYRLLGAIETEEIVFDQLFPPLGKMQLGYSKPSRKVRVHSQPQHQLPQSLHR